jgi:hypothetical protein
MEWLQASPLKAIFLVTDQKWLGWRITIQSIMHGQVLATA